MDGHSILIVESEVSAFAMRLQEAIEQTGAASLIVQNPYSLTGVDLMKRFTFTAAVVNVQHSALALVLPVPVLVYGHDETPAQTDVIVSKLWRLLDYED